MSSGKPDLPTTLAKHRENFQSWVDFVKKGLSHVILNNLFFFKVFHLIMPLIIIRHRNKKFQLFQPKQEKNSWFSSFSSQFLKKGPFSSFSSQSGHPVKYMVHLYVHFHIKDSKIG